MVEERRRLLRSPADREQRTTSLELFFDLVFVFAVTQLSHLLSGRLTAAGAGQTLFLLLVVWWGWTYTAWMTNWFDPESPAVRGVLVAVMVASLVMAIAIPDAFSSRPLLFAAGYVGLQVIRNAFAAWEMPRSHAMRAGVLRILIWSLASAPLWIAGALLSGPARVALWLAALALDYAGPLAGYWLPRRGREPQETWSVESGHFAERFQLFVIIALGESIVVTGASAARTGLGADAVIAMVVAFLATAAMWWLYFDYVAAIAQRRLELSDRRIDLARDAYTYLHLPMIAGIIVAAVGNGIVIAHPGALPDGPQVAALVGGPALYLLGHVAFRLRIAGSLSRKRLSAAIAILALGPLALVLPALPIAALIVASLVALIGAETVSGRRRRAAGQPSPMERLEAAAGRRP